MAESAICVAVKDEEELVLEWIAYHHLLGFETIIVLDDESVDTTPAKVMKAAKHIDVRLLSWPEAQKGKQASVYHAMCRYLRRQYQWVAFIDIDEFIVPKNDVMIGSLLTERWESASVVMPWRMFGSAGHVQIPPGLTIENYIYRSDDQFSPNRHVKSIVRPEAVLDCPNPHFFTVDGEHVLPDGRSPNWEHPGILDCSLPLGDTWRVNHYFTRSLDHWLKRLSRGQLGETIREEEDFFTYDVNGVEDKTAARYAERVNALLEKMR